MTTTATMYHHPLHRSGVLTGRSHPALTAYCPSPNPLQTSYLAARLALQHFNPCILRRRYEPSRAARLSTVGAHRQLLASSTHPTTALAVHSQTLLCHTHLTSPTHLCPDSTLNGEHGAAVFSNYGHTTIFKTVSLMTSTRACLQLPSCLAVCHMQYSSLACFDIWLRHLAAELMQTQTVKPSPHDCLICS